MDSERNLQILIELINKIMPALIIIIALAVIYFFFNADALRGFIYLLAPLLFYVVGLSAAYTVRRRKAKKIAAEVGDSEMTIKINYFTFFWHDALVFITPSAIILFAFWTKGEVTFYDMIYSVIAMTGLYLSTLIYKRKII